MSLRINGVFRRCHWRTRYRGGYNGHNRRQIVTVCRWRTIFSAVFFPEYDLPVEILWLWLILDSIIMVYFTVSVLIELPHNFIVQLHKILPFFRAWNFLNLKSLYNIYYLPKMVVRLKLYFYSSGLIYRAQ